MTVIKEFKAFAMRGNVVDLAVGVVIGGAFGKVVSALVTSVIMPPIGLLLGGIDLSGFVLTMKAAQGTVPAVELKYGAFLGTIVDFLIIAFAIFLVVKLMNKMRKAEPVPEATTRECPACLMAIPIAAKRCGFCTTQF